MRRGLQQNAEEKIMVPLYALFISIPLAFFLGFVLCAVLYVDGRK